MYYVIFLQVTNQMVSACKSYITARDTMRVWEVPFNELLDKFKTCHELFQHYQTCFQNAKERATKSSRTFEVSDMYVFGKFSSFCRRLSQIQEVVEIIQQFSVLRKSRIEGIDALNTRFGHMASSIKKKPYNPLDHRKMEFQGDYDEFVRQVSELQDVLCSFMRTTFSKVRSCLQSLHLLKRLAIRLYCNFVHEKLSHFCGCPQSAKSCVIPIPFILKQQSFTY